MRDAEVDTRDLAVEEEELAVHDGSCLDAVSFELLWKSAASVHVPRRLSSP